MDVRALRYCLTIAELKSFTRAAEVLHVAQPALSVAVKKLENELGVTLFVRSARGIAPTVEGKLLLQRAERIFGEIESARREIEDVVELRSGEVRVGMPPMFGLEFFPRIMTRFHQRYPGLKVAAVEGSADEIGGLLDKGEIDLAILETRRIRKDWSRVLVGREEMVICVDKKHPLARKKSVLGSDLDGLAIAALNGRFIQRSLLDGVCEKARVKPRIVLEANSVPIITRAAADGLGAATLLRSLAVATPGLVALSFTPKQMLSFSMCWINDRYMSQANRSFLEFSKEEHRLTARSS